MALKTLPTKKSVPAFLKGSPRPEEGAALAKLFAGATGEKPVLWGDSIVGYGRYHYKSERSRQEGDWPLTGFSPRKGALTVYVMPGFKPYGALLKKLGPHTTSVGCLYIKRLDAIHLPTLKKLIKQSVKDMRKKYGAA
ncbi:MAG TPA: DUF1801 domain-containing protein [Candidatus Paceibacterota bacterium]|nr:DUF1801 domain-containing protein [Candidatus Paceibacterota bacterium]